MITFGNFEAKISVDIANLILLFNNVSVIIETLIYGCLMFIVPFHCCQNLTLPNVPTRRLLPGNQTTAASATV